MTLKELQPHPIQSKTVLGQGYDPITRILYILFVNTGVYAYHDIIPGEYDKFLKAESAGKWLYKEIIPNKYVEKVTLPG